MGQLQVFRFPALGGEDLVTPNLSRKPGTLAFSHNIVPSVLGGYERVSGYERFDGRPAPSNAEYYYLTFDSASSQINVGDTLTGAASSASARVHAVVLESGSWTGNGVGYLILSAGGFQNGEDLRVGGFTVARATRGAEQSGGPTPLSPSMQDGWLKLDADWRRSLIQPVPGSGPVRGVWLYNDTVYAFRDSADGTQCLMYEATPTGWQQVSLGSVTLAPGGKFRFVNYNFQGHSGQVKMYGVDGVNKAFEFDGTTFTQITTGMPVDKPVHLAAHKNHLWLAFPGGSLQYSPVGDPTGTWSVVTGAGELALGEEITGLLGQVQDQLIVWTRNTTRIVSGTPGVDLAMRYFSSTQGAEDGTVARLPDPVFYSNASLRTMQTTARFGDFQFAEVSTLVRPFLLSRDDEAKLAAPLRKSDQYRLFYPDGTVLVMRLVPKQIAFTRLKYEFRPFCVASVEDTAGNERVFVGAEDGYVYELEKGRSFDGAPIQAVLRFSYTDMQAPVNYKRLVRLALEFQSRTRTDIRFHFSFDYFDPDLGNEYGSVAADPGFSLWDVSKWNRAVWSVGDLSVAEAYVDGVGYNTSLTIVSEDDFAEPWMLKSVMLEYMLLGRRR